MKRHNTKHRWWYQKYEKYILHRVMLPPQRYKPTMTNDGYNEMRELIFQCWYRGIAPSTAVILFRVLNLERIHL